MSGQLNWMLGYKQNNITHGVTYCYTIIAILEWTQDYDFSFVQTMILKLLWRIDRQNNSTSLLHCHLYTEALNNWATETITANLADKALLKNSSGVKKADCGNYYLNKEKDSG